MFGTAFFMGIVEMDAYTFLQRYALRTSEPFSPEEVIEAAEVVGITFQEKRAWGGVFHAAHKDGVIQRAGLFSRKSSNGSVRPGWVRA
jgi:hypothetical protein